MNVVTRWIDNSLSHTKSDDVLCICCSLFNTLNTSAGAYAAIFHSPSVCDAQSDRFWSSYRHTFKEIIMHTRVAVKTVKCCSKFSLVAGLLSLGGGWGGGLVVYSSPECRTRTGCRIRCGGGYDAWYMRCHRLWNWKLSKRRSFLLWQRSSTIFTDQSQFIRKPQRRTAKPVFPCSCSY